MRGGRGGPPRRHPPLESRNLVKVFVGAAFRRPGELQ
jgi:hypothetical protein